MHSKRPRLIVTCREHSPPIARASYSDRLAAKSWPVSHLNRGVEAVHIQVDNAPGSLLRWRGGSHAAETSPFLGERVKRLDPLDRSRREKANWLGKIELYL